VVFSRRQRGQRLDNLCGKAKDYAIVRARLHEIQEILVANKQPLLNKSALIRAYLREHPDASATEVGKALKEQGIDIHLALICVVRARIDDEPTSSANRSPKRNRPLKVATQGSKAQAIREAMQRLGSSAATSVIIAYLKKKGIVVATAQVASVRARTERSERR
jgi:hypothetical protein